MNKRMGITIAIIVSAFIALNIHLLYSNKSTVPKSLYVHQYERMTPGHFEETIQKEGFVTPEEIYTVYVGDGEAIETWFIEEGDQVQVGDEIAILQTERAESQLAAWSAEEEGLLEQRSSLHSILSALEADRASAQNNSANVNTTETPGDSDIELTVDVQVDVSQDGSFAQAIAEAERELSEIDRKLAIVQAQLDQNPSRPALISPVDGTVSNVSKNGVTLAAEIYSEMKLITTYAQLDEWQKIEVGDLVRIQENNLDTVIEGEVHSVSAVPATDSRWQEAYDSLDRNERKNPLDIYEIRMKTSEQPRALPFGANVSASIIVNEADAVSVKIHWLESYSKNSAIGWKLDEQGRGIKTKVAVPFESNSRGVIAEGLQVGDVAIYNQKIADYKEPFGVILQLPLELPSKNEWRTFGWKNYVKYGFLE